MKTFNPTATHTERAVQMWQILVALAMHRQTLTYEGLSILMYGKKAPGVLAPILGHVHYYCQQHQLPKLNFLVNGKGSGIPGFALPTEAEALELERERVYAYDWYNLYPPSEAELRSAYEVFKGSPLTV